MWGPAVAGTIEEGETYDGNIVKEAEEELGLNISTHERQDKLWSQGECDHFTQWYRWIYDGQPIHFAENEVAEVKWWTKAELKEAFKTHPEEFLSQMSVWVERF